mgnify:FL=1|tara:strand:- start:1368 stop:1781 length:414 start_codon:yes stop_codon:yes gene_type:complete
MEPRLIEKYRVGGNIKTLGAHETRWQFGNHEIRVRVRRGNWQYYMNANSRISGWNGRSLKDFPEWLDVRCPTMTEEELPKVEKWLRHELAEDHDTRTYEVTNKRYLPRQKEFVGQPSRYMTFECDRGKPEVVQSWTD